MHQDGFWFKSQLVGLISHCSQSEQRAGPGNPVSATALNFNQHKAGEQTPNTKQVLGVSGSSGHHIFTLLQETVGCAVVYLCRKWLKGSKLSANGMKTPDVYGFCC